MILCKKPASRCAGFFAFLRLSFLPSYNWRATLRDFVMRVGARIICIAYWLLLTVLLLVPNPAALVGLHAVPIFPWGKFGVHLGFFTVLGFLVNATRWPKRPWWPMIALLLVYGITTESLQLFVPHRTARVMDAIEDVLGIAAGSAVYWLLLRLRRPSLVVKQTVEADVAGERRRAPVEY
jgi:hypothetical protein